MDGNSGDELDQDTGSMWTPPDKLRASRGDSGSCCIIGRPTLTRQRPPFKDHTVGTPFCRECPILTAAAGKADGKTFGP